MTVNSFPSPRTFGLLPEPERRPSPFVTSGLINLIVLAIFVYIGLTAKRVLDQHHYEQTVLILPALPPAPTKIKISPRPEPPVQQPLPELKLSAPKIKMPKPEPTPEPKLLQMEAKAELPVIKTTKQAIVLAPQPRPVVAAAVPVHLGDMFGVRPNTNSTRPATIAALGNPYGGADGTVVALRGVIGATGIGNGPGRGSGSGNGGKVASVGIPGIPAPVSATFNHVPRPTQTGLEILFKPSVQYTAEAKQLRIQGDVILRVTFTASGQVHVNAILRGLGHGLDEEATRVAEQIRFHPATADGRPADTTTNITITFQLA